MRTFKATIKKGKSIEFNARWYKDGHGTWRFVSGIARYLVDEQHVDLNRLWLATGGSDNLGKSGSRFTTEEMMRFYVSLGYSLSGFYEIFGEKAEIWIDGAKMGTTPTNLTLKRKDEYLLTIKKEGYKESTLKIKHETSSWIIGNIIFGGIIGCGIDFINGGAYDLSPERLDVSLTKISELDGQTLLVPDKYYKSINEIRFLNEKGLPEITITITAD